MGESKNNGYINPYCEVGEFIPYYMEKQWEYRTHLLFLLPQQKPSSTRFPRPPVGSYAFFSQAMAESSSNNHPWRFPPPLKGIHFAEGVTEISAGTWDHTPIFQKIMGKVFVCFC